MLGAPNLTPPVKQHIGAALRADGTPFYLSTLAPELAAALEAPWQGAFYAQFGVGDVVGKVMGDPTQSMASVTVSARLLVAGKEHVSAEWEVIGSKISTPSKMAMIRSIKIAAPGPHDLNDIRRCIALHAPQRVFGEAKALIAMQCGVAVACLIEAIC